MVEDEGDALELQEVYYNIHGNKRKDNYHHGAVCVSAASIESMSLQCHRMWRTASMAQAGRLPILKCMCDEMKAEGEIEVELEGASNGKHD